jgi:hypothetical protein
MYVSSVSFGEGSYSQGMKESGFGEAVEALLTTILLY